MDKAVSSRLALERTMTTGFMSAFRKAVGGVALGLAALVSTGKADIIQVSSFKDFTPYIAANGGAKAILPNMDVVPYVPIPGDANLDGAVDLQDFGILKSNFGATSGATWGQGDFNGDGGIDLQDFGLLKGNFGAGQSNAVPGATTLLTTSFGAVTVLRKRKRRTAVIGSN